MKISVIGTGYVGLVLGACMADYGNDVICMDKDEKKVRDLKKGIIPIYEPGLSDVFNRSVDSGRLVFTTDIKDAVIHAEVIFLALPTPMGETFKADLSAIKVVCGQIGNLMKKFTVIVTKSTVPVGTADMIRKKIKESQKTKVDFDVVSNPEFLREGAAVKDFQNPDRIIIGVDNGRAKELMLSLYKPMSRVSNPIMMTDVRSAELVKYASNAMLATRISFMNQLSALCEAVGADIREVSIGMGTDKRIGSRFLQAGIGYGGSCFPKDVKALIHNLKENNCDASLFEAVDTINEKQKKVVARKIEKMMDIKGGSFCLWGISFKPRTDDIREAPSLMLIKELFDKGAREIRVFDPIAMKSLKEIYPEIAERVYFAEDAYDAAVSADCIVLVTEWDIFRSIDLEKTKKLMKQDVFIDGRNIYDKKEMDKLGFRYSGIGR